jgi:hypothetical protein
LISKRDGGTEVDKQKLKPHLIYTQLITLDDEEDNYT